MPALTGTGSKPPAAITVLHSCGSFAIVWHIADVQTALMNVRFEGNNGHDANGPLCRLMTQSGLSGSAQAREVLATLARDGGSLARNACNCLSQCPYLCHWHAGPRR